MEVSKKPAFFGQSLIVDSMVYTKYFTVTYMIMPDAKNEIYPLMIVDPVVLLQLERYKFVKESSSSGILDNPVTSGRTILMNTDNENKLWLSEIT